jgi:outer membrane protein insertion porin family
LVRLIRFLTIGWCLIGLALPPSPAEAQSGGVVREIIVEGTQRIEPETVRSYLLIQEGDPFNAERVDRSLKSLFATGLFADVTIGRQHDSMVVTVVENPVINRIAFEGNTRLEDEVLETEVTLRPRVIYTRTKVQNDVKRILTLYRRSGRFAATVEPKVIQLPQNRVDLVFEVNEGRLTEVESIRFVGNREFGDSRLREVIRTKETRWYRFFTSDDTYDPDRLTLDRELLRRFYLQKGYADFRVVSGIAELTPDRRDFFLTFTMEEGVRYRFGEVTVEAHLRDLKTEDLAGVIEIEKEDWYDADEVDHTIDALTDAVGALGYAFLDIRPRINRDREAQTIDVVFEVNEGPRVFVERIDISGNVRTVDEVIRREFRLIEGDAFNSAKLRRSRQRIQNLNFFEKISVERVPGSAPDKAVVKVEVEEKSTGSLSVGAGYSTTSGAMGDIGIRERNLLGRGQDIKLNLILAERQSQVDFSFTEPYFMDREVAAGFDLFHVATDLQDTSSYDSKISGLSLRAGYPISERLRQRWKYTIKQSKVTNVDDDASVFVQDEEGSRILSEVSQTLTYDRRDNRIAPTEGYFGAMSNDLAGIGGDTRYLRTTFKAGKYYSLTDQWVLAFTGRTGYIFGLGEDVRLSDRYFIGGDDLRGFATHGVGPRDKDTNDALGGEWMYSGSAELSFPLGLPSEFAISGRIFSDLGSSGSVNPSGASVSDTASLRASLGAGIGWISPFGPIGIDVGFPVLKESIDETEAFRINFGTRF